MNRIILISIAVVAALAAAAAPTFGASKALMVGVQEYPETAYRLMGIREDLGLLKNALMKAGVLREPEIKVLLDKEATKDNITRAFKEWLIEGTKPGDMALFYFSGHGIQIWDQNDDEVQDGIDEALMPWDAKVTKGKERREFKGRIGSAFPPDGAQNFLIDDEIAELLKQMQGRRVVFISDSCHAGTVHKSINPFVIKYKTILDPIAYKSVFAPRTATKGAKALKREKTALGQDLMVKGSEIAVFTASEDSQPAAIVPFDRPPTGYHSVFTWHLLHALEGKADLNQDGRITLGELAKYLEDEISRGNFEQIPQHEFQPKGLANADFVMGLTSRQAHAEKPSVVGCYVDAGTGISPDEVRMAQQRLGGALVPLSWTKDRGLASCLIELRKSGSTYGGRLTDSTGSFWEPHNSPDLVNVLNGLVGDLKAYYVQTSVAALKNPDTALDLDLSYSIKSPTPRSEAEMVKGDVVSFRARTKTPGYLYIFNVDTQGVIHPLYPDLRKAPPTKLDSLQTVDIGADGSITVEPPFGRDLVFAFLAKQLPESLNRFWQKDDVGDPSDAKLTEQGDFLDALWRELGSAGTKGGWTSRLWFLRSFESAQQ